MVIYTTGTNTWLHSSYTQYNIFSTYSIFTVQYESELSDLGSFVYFFLSSVAMQQLKDERKLIDVNFFFHVAKFRVLQILQSFEKIYAKKEKVIAVFGLLDKAGKAALTKFSIVRYIVNYKYSTNCSWHLQQM